MNPINAASRIFSRACIDAVPLNVFKNLHTLPNTYEHLLRVCLRNCLHPSYAVPLDISMNLRFLDEYVFAICRNLLELASLFSCTSSGYF